MRVDALTGQAPTLSKQFAVDGTVADVGDVTYAVVDGNGDPVTSGTATKAGSGTTTTYTFTLAAQSNPAFLEVTWTSTTPVVTLVDHVEVTRSGLFTEAEARAYKSAGLQTPFADTVEWSDADLSEWRVRIGDLFESATGVSWVRRYCRAEFAGTGCYDLHLRTGQARTSTGARAGGKGRMRHVAPTILSATVDGVAVSTGNVKVLDGGRLWRVDGTWSTPTVTDPLNVVVEWEYGVWPVDHEAQLNGLRMLGANAIRGDTSAFASTVNAPDGTQQIVQGGWAYPPKVWDWLKRVDARLGIG